MSDLDDDVTAFDPPAVLLPLLTVEEAPDVLEVLAAVVAGERADVDLARSLSMHLAARVPSRE
ncbi:MULTISPECIES: hypothetical protein [unclassified Streptomyces]|uniref:hypothetical protein n=1 Tax=unclassified Streptomyces TaxID=2593676 RepID=UPI002DD7C162|nr:hypothetical protein [Streptomyces sp. NBC_01445]WSE02209.1 hypothetical protein OG574_01525 [Streptomyces sp. NBC_01445]